MTYIKIPLEEIIDRWLEEQGLAILWDDEQLVDQGSIRGPSLILHVANLDQIHITNNKFYDDTAEFLEDYEVKLA
jgi:hypothetical protein